VSADLARQRPSGARSATALVASLLAAFSAAGIGAAATNPRLDEWYATLDKPSWNPPDGVFGPVWSILYAAQAIAAWIVWRSGGEHRAPALRLYGAQLLLNTAWSLIFFGLRAPGLAVVEIALLWVAIAATVKAFRSCSRPAALLMLPYLAWVTFAAALNLEIWRRNA
jgi:tryptophan-rich sensory protein